MTQGAGRTIEWASYGQPVRITRGDNEVQFAYGPDRARYVRVDTQNKGQSDEHTQTKVMLGAYERVTSTDGTNEARYYVGGIAIVTRDLTTSTDTTRYALKDNQGSVLGYAEDSAGYPGSLQTAFDPWGWRRDVNGQVLPISDLVKDEYKTVSARGYTGQEQVDLVGLIHMNGRVYDPILGRFISADPVIQDATDSQAYNRYAYVRNNPLSLTDPSGFSWLGDRWHAFKEGGWRSVAAVVNPQLAFAGYTTDKGLREFGRFARKNKYVAEIAQIAGCAYAPYACGAIVEATTYAVTDGDIGATLKAGAIAYVQMGFANAIGANFDTSRVFSTSSAMAVGAHGLLGGGVSLAQGGKFGHGFAAGAFGKAASIGMAGSNAYGVLRIDGEDFVALVSRTSISAAIGGTASNLSGGNFANGAVTAAMQHLFNAEASSSEKRLGAHDPNGGAYEVDVPVDVRNAMSNALGTDVSGITVVANSKWANFLNWINGFRGYRVDATTLTNTIYLPSHVSPQDFFNNSDLMLHEYYHVVNQWNNGRMNVFNYLISPHTWESEAIGFAQNNAYIPNHMLFMQGRRQW